VRSVDHFRYLGIILDSTGEQDRELQRRISTAEYSFKRLRPALMAKRGLSLHNKSRLFKTFVVPALTYGGPETWALRNDQLQRMQTAYNSMLRRMTHQPLGPEGISNQELYAVAQTTDLALQLEERRLRRLGHIARRGDGALVKQLLFAEGLPGHRRPVGRPRVTWWDGAKRTLDRLGMQGGWLELADNRKGWAGMCGRVYEV